MPDALLLTGCAFASTSTGGETTFAKHMVKAFGPRLAVVGLSADAQPVGRWFQRQIGSRRYDFFGILAEEDLKREKQGLVPERLRVLVAYTRHMAAVRRSGIRNAWRRRCTRGTVSATASTG